MPTAKDEAHALGLVYGGFAGWVDPKDPSRKVVAKTVKNKLVRVTGDEDAIEKDTDDLGRLTIFDLDFEVIYANPKQNRVALKDYITLMKSILHVGSDFVILIKKNGEKDAATFLKKIGIIHGVKLSPLGSFDPEKKKRFVEKKIKEGYTEIQYYDRDEKAISAISSLKATYNKLDIRIDAHKVPTFKAVAANASGLSSNKEPQDNSKNYVKGLEKAPQQEKGDK